MADRRESLCQRLMIVGTVRTDSRVIHREGFDMSNVVRDTSGNDDLASYDPGKYSQVESDSNLQATVTIGEGHIERRSGGADDAGLRDSNLGAGGRSIA